MFVFSVCLFVVFSPGQNLSFDGCLRIIRLACRGCNGITGLMMGWGKAEGLQRDRETETEIDRQTEIDREGDRQTDRQTEIDREGERETETLRGREGGGGVETDRVRD